MSNKSREKVTKAHPGASPDKKHAYSLTNMTD